MLDSDQANLPAVLAILYDIHGNLEALDAVIADARLQGAYRWVLGGDYAVMGPDPDGVFDRLKKLRSAAWIKGNTDRWITEPESSDIPDNEAIASAIVFARERLGFDRLQELSQLPPTYASDGIFFCHASPKSDMNGFSNVSQPDEEQLIRGSIHATIACGHTHIQFRRQVGMSDVLNPGSVGMPFDGDASAAYALRHDDGTLDMRRVAYPIAQTLAKLTEQHSPWAELAKQRLEQAAFVA